MKILMYILVLIVAVATSGCLQDAPDDSQTRQIICTVEDQEAGTCPPGGLTILQWTQQRQAQYAQSQLPGQTPTELGSSCSNGVCTADWTFNTIWGHFRLITSCNSCQCNSTGCWVSDGPCMHIVPGPTCMRD